MDGYLASRTWHPSTANGVSAVTLIMIEISLILYYTESLTWNAKLIKYHICKLTHFCRRWETNKLILPLANDLCNSVYGRICCRSWDTCSYGSCVILPEKLFWCNMLTTTKLKLGIGQGKLSRLTDNIASYVLKTTGCQKSQSERQFLRGRKWPGALTTPNSALFCLSVKEFSTWIIDQCAVLPFPRLSAR